MSLLRNQTDALALAAQLDKAALEKRLGTLPAVEGSIVGALYNADTEGKMNMLLYSNPAGIVAGMAAAVKLSGAQGAILVTDQEINVQEYTAAAATAGVVLTIEQAAMVNKTAHKKDLMMTFEALAALAEKMTGRTPGIFAAVDDRVPEEVSPDISVGALIGSDENYKGIVAGHRFYTAEEVKNMPLGRLETWGGWIRTVKQSDCAVDIARQEVHALRQKSCGKCTFCREGLYQIEQIFNGTASGRAEMKDLALADEIGKAMEVSCNCTLGDRAGVPAVSLLKTFGAETEAHIRRKECPAGVCLVLTKFYIDPSLCTGSGACVDICPEHCIEGKDGYVSLIDEFDCTRCGKCLDVCAAGAVKKVSGRMPKLPAKRPRLKGAAAVSAEI